MSATRPIITTTALTLVLFGCGGSGENRADGRDGQDAIEDDGCATGTFRLGADCWSPVGTHWRVTADGPGGEYRFELELLAAGRARATDHPRARAATDEWFQVGHVLRVFMSDRFVEYRATISNGTVLNGEAINVRGQRWTWRGDRVFNSSTCSDSEALLHEGGCMTVEGTRWQMRAAGHEGRDGPFIVEFLADGVVATDDGTTGHWQQSGGALSFTTRADEAAREVSLEDASEIGAADGSWSATRIASIPPVMHR